MIVLGIDPGASGGLAMLSRSDGATSVLAVDRIPGSYRDVWDWITENRDRHGCDLAVIERVHAMPGQGVTSTFKFGQSYGSLRMAVVAAGIPLDDVTPRKWQPAVGVHPIKNEGKTDHKNRLKARAQEMFPGVRVTHAIADALLISAWAMRHN